MANTINLNLSDLLQSPEAIEELSNLVGVHLAASVKAAADSTRKQRAEGTVHEGAGTATLVARRPSRLLFQKLVEQAVVPSRSHPTDAGFDLVSIEHFVIPAGERHMTRTGVAVAIPNGFVGLVAPRSGLAYKHGISVTNAPGIVDAGYRGELKCIIHNLGHEPFEIKPGDRIAQLVVTPFLQWESEEVAELPEADRGDNGFGSTGR